MNKETLSLLGIIAVILLVLGGSYAFTRWAGRRLGGGWPAAAGGGRLRVLDRLPLGRDQALIVALVGRRYLLLSSSPAGLTLLAELTAEEGEQWNTPPPAERAGPHSFGALLNKLKNTEEKR